jgi:chromosome segregation ATPase
MTYSFAFPFRTDCSSDLVQSTATKVLFGMIVRERRRVAALAKAAASLDERVQSAEKNLAFSESALRSYMDDHRQAIADLEEKQHDHLRTLIEMVNEDSNQAALTSDDLEGNDLALSEVKYQKMLLVLANERVSVLEDQLAEMSSQNATVEEYATKIDELNELLLSKNQECEGLEQTRRDLRTGLRKIRDEVLRHPNLRSGSVLYTSVLDLVDGHLHLGATWNWPPKGDSAYDVAKV